MITHFHEAMSQKTKSVKYLYRLIHKHGPVSKSALIELAGMKPSTCARLIEELLAQGLIMESGLGESSGGRKPLMYAIRPDVSYVIGVDVSRLHIRLLLMDLSLAVVGEAKLPLDQDSTPDVAIAFIEEQIERLLAQHQLDVSRVLGIGVGAVGPLDREQGVMTGPLQFPGPNWRDVPIAARLRERFSMPVLLDNGANTAVLGEYWSGLWKEVDSVVYNLTGIGIRCGVLANGQVVRGPVDMEGTYGHMVVDIHGRKCSCGQFGCLEAYSTLPAIRDEVIRHLKRGKPSLIAARVADDEEIELADIAWAVANRDSLCCEVVKDAAYHYGIGLSNMMYLIHPEVIILGGALVTEMDLFYEVATQTALQRASIVPGYQVRFSRGTLGEHAVAVGAGCMVMNHYLE
ncbi:UNVERIFIED_CONTAM: putative NBD/HSP70 family sugar kinase [Brevibacillus sp. OAP136]